MSGIVGWYFLSNSHSGWGGQIIDKIGDDIYVVKILWPGDDAVTYGDHRIVTAKDMHFHRWELSPVSVNRWPWSYPLPEMMRP